MVVDYMRQGLAPTEACQAAIRRIVKQEGKGPNLSINFVALDKSGRFGGAGTDTGFSFSVTTPGSSRVLPNAGAGKL
jgi:isoaspartyl peptidase/L-asparaginase-like protein (Ntn-hydrolase superfamily)